MIFVAAVFFLDGIEQFRVGLVELVAVAVERGSNGIQKSNSGSDTRPGPARDRLGRCGTCRRIIDCGGRHATLARYCTWVRSVFAAATMFVSAGITSAHWRVFRPQSGFTHRRSAGISSAAFFIRPTI